MSIQILKQRPKDGDPTNQSFWWVKPKIEAPTIRDLMANPESCLRLLPEAERYNIFYTVHESDSNGLRPRQFKRTNTLIFDIDNIIKGREQDYIQVTSSVLQIPPGEQIAWVASGNGLHAIICLDAYQEDPSYFRAHREQYRKICDDLYEALAAQRLSYVDELTGLTIGKPDPAVFDAARVLRMPGTINKKPGRPDTQCQLISGAMSPIAWDWEKVSGIPDIVPGDELNAGQSETVSEEFEEVFGVPDTDAVLNGCEFIKHVKADAKVLPEPEWYMSLNILGRLENGVALAHEYSKDHPKYTPQETNRKLQQALTKSRAYLCKTINQQWGKCHECKYFQKVTTPLSIVGPDHIKTAGDQGFHNRIPGKKPIPNYEDLRRFFEQKHRYKTMERNKIVYTWRGTHWAQYSDSYLENFAEINFSPKPRNQMCHEFVGIVKRTNLIDPNWMFRNSEQKINFQNGTLDLKTDQFTEHRPEYGMTSTLPYDYKPEATAVRFEQFLLEITCNRPELAEALLEYMGYCFSGDQCWLHKSLILYGGGRNGKSLFMRIMQALAGPDAFSSVMLNDLQKDTCRIMLMNKLFNLSEETPDEAMMDSAVYKNLVAGGYMDVREQHGKPVQIQNKTKLIQCCNDLPRIKNIGVSITERCAIIPFDAEFTTENGKQDPHLYEKMIPELPGIMNLIIGAWKQLRARGEFIKLPILKKMTEELQLENDNVYVYLKDELEISPEFSETTPGVDRGTLYKNFRSWCEANGIRPTTSNWFFHRLKRHVKNLDDRITRPRGMDRFYRGIHFRSIIN